MSMIRSGFPELDPKVFSFPMKILIYVNLCKSKFFVMVQIKSQV